MEDLRSLEEIQSQIKVIRLELEELRHQMERIGSELGLLSTEVIEVSQKLDEKINQFMRLSIQVKQLKKPTT